jgi:hypothetical protein
MSDRRTVQVVINVTVDSIGACHWFVTSQEELETVTWTDDGQALYPLNATDQAIECARSELRHLLSGGQVGIYAP